MLPLWTKRTLCQKIPKETNYMHTTLTMDEDDATNNEDVESHTIHIFHLTRCNHLSRDRLLCDSQSSLDWILKGKYLTKIHPVQQSITMFCNAGSKTIKRIYLENLRHGITLMELQICCCSRQELIITMLHITVMTGVEHSTCTLPKTKLNLFNTHRGSIILIHNKKKYALILLAMTIKTSYFGCNYSLLPTGNDWALFATWIPGDDRWKIDTELPCNFQWCNKCKRNIWTWFFSIKREDIAEETNQNTTRICDVLGERIEQDKLVTLTADIVFVYQIPFIIMYRRGVGLMSVEWILNRTGKELGINLTKMLQLYSGWL